MNSIRTCICVCVCVCAKYHATVYQELKLRREQTLKVKVRRLSDKIKKGVTTEARLLARMHTPRPGQEDGGTGVK